MTSRPFSLSSSPFSFFNTYNFNLHFLHPPKDANHHLTLLPSVLHNSLFKLLRYSPLLLFRPYWYMMDMVNAKAEDMCLASVPKLPAQSGRPSSMVFKKRLTMIPAHLVAEAISTLHGLDLRWSGPITPTEMQYVEQYVFAKYPQYCNGLVDGDHTNKNNLEFDLENLGINEESEASPDPEKPPNKSFSPKNFAPSSSSHSFTSNTLSDLDKTPLEPSRLLDVFAKKASFLGNFISIPEIQAGNRALKHCGLNELDYLVLFMTNYKEAMEMIGESYPFFKGNYYLTIIGDQFDGLRDYAISKEAKVVPAPETWLDLRIKGSQLSQHFRKKCKHIPKGLFSYPAVVDGTRYSMHWISEAHRNSWHVLLDATGLVFGEERLNLALHRPDFVMCTLDNTHAHPSKVTCLLVRRSSFDTTQ